MNGAPASRWGQARGKLVVSCQASSGDAFYGPGLMARFARAAVDGGAGAIRAHGPADIASIRASVSVPILGIYKETVDDGAILITPSFERAREVALAGADAIAIDCTSRGIARGALERLRRTRRELGLPVMADIATVEEAETAAAAGADFVLSTMRGYTADTSHLRNRFEPEFIAEQKRRLTVPVIAEGRIASPGDAREAMRAGAWAVVVGSAITRPHEITRAYADAVAAAARSLHVAALDLGATNIKYGLVSGSGEIRASGMMPTPDGSPVELLAALRAALRTCLSHDESKTVDCVSVATAGWVDPGQGTIAYATGNLQDWTGASVAGAIAVETDLPVFVENDAIAAAAGEWLYGAARGARHALCLTLGTGVGGGAIVDGRLLRGAHGLANMIGHLRLPDSNRPCTCGLTGCLEAEVGKGGAARIAAEFGSLEEWTAAIARRDTTALAALREYSVILASGIAPALHLLDPEVVVLAGGLAASGPALLETLEETLSKRTLAWHKRHVRIELSSAGQYAGVRGAAAVAALNSGL